MIRLPFPPSANKYWRTNYQARVTYPSAEAEDYKAEVRLLCRAAQVEVIQGPVEIVVDAIMPSTNRDLGNTQKVLEDALEGVWYLDDLQIHRQVYTRYEAPSPKRENACVLVEVRPWSLVSGSSLYFAHYNKPLSTPKPRGKRT